MASSCKQWSRAAAAIRILSGAATPNEWTALPRIRPRPTQPRVAVRIRALGRRVCGVHAALAGHGVARIRAHAIRTPTPRALSVGRTHRHPDAKHGSAAAQCRRNLVDIFRFRGVLRLRTACKREAERDEKRRGTDHTGDDLHDDLRGKNFASTTTVVPGRFQATCRLQLSAEDVLTLAE